MSENNITDVNEADFNDQVVEASTSKLIVVDFWAPWCGPCKQLTPSLEKVVRGSSDKVSLVKINIDDNQQIAAQLRIQSIPTVYAFKNKEIVNAFQGVIPENKIIEFIEKSLGSKLTEDFTGFYEQIENEMSQNKFEETKDILIEFISKNPTEIKAINFYLECLLKLKQFDEIDEFIGSLNKEMQEKDEIKQIEKKLKIIKNNLSGPSLEDLLNKLENNKNDIDLIVDVSDKYFSMQDYENCFEILLNNYPINKDRVKEKMVELFAVLGNSNEHTVNYRKKLSQIMFA
jgi:putative thioredoxin